MTAATRTSSTSRGPPLRPSTSSCCARTTDCRGRKRGETGALLRQGFLAAGFPADRISAEIYREEEAVQRSLESAQPGDLLVIFGDKLDRDWQQIVSFGRPAEAPAASVPFAPLFSGDEPPLASPVIVEASAGRRAGEHED